MAYDRAKAVAYAHEWAFGRNPRYLNFTGLGGDCTNFVSQCLLAGGAPMNYQRTFGWYYTSASDRAPAWTGVNYLYNFLMSKPKTGPRAREITISELQPGDVVQLSFTAGVWGHTLLVVETGGLATLDTVLIATHSDDSDYRPLSSYYVVARRYLQIEV